MKAFCISLVVFLASFCSIANAENVSIQSGVRLAGSFYPAAGTGKHAAVILLAGSGKAPRDNVFFHALERTFNEASISVLAYDKRGSGESGGVYDDNTALAVLANDGIAAAHYLQTRSDVDPKRIGVWGVSQGGWVGPLMATMSPDVAFVISVSGPGVSIAEQAIYLRGTQMLAQGFSAQDVAEETAYRRVVWAYFGTGFGRDAAQAALDAAKDRPWFTKLELPKTLSTPEALDPALHDFMQQAASYDPLDVAKRVKVPILFVFGGKDSIAPASESIENLMQAIGRGGNQKAAFLLFPNAGHGIQVVNTAVECHECSEREVERTQKWDVDPGFFPAMTAWLRAILPT